MTLLSALGLFPPFDFSFSPFSLSAYADPAPIRIGVILPLTGEASFWGTHSKNGALLALEDFNKGEKHFELVFEDSQCDPKLAVSAYQRLTTMHKVDFLIGDICSSATLAVAAVSNKAQKLLITPCSAAPAISSAGEYVFRTWSPTTLETRATADYAYSATNYRKVAVLYIENDFGNSIEKDFVDRFEELGGTIVFRDSHTPAETDLRTQLVKVKASGAEAIFLVSHIADGLVAVKQARELGITLPIIGTTGINSQSDFVDKLGPLAEGIVIGDQKDLVEESFKQRYAKAYGMPWPGYSSCAAASYDCVSLIAKAIEAVADDKPQSVQKWLAETKNFPGVSGPIQFDPNGDAVRPSQMYRIQNGKIVAIP